MDDIIVIGNGLAGMTAAIYAAMEGNKVSIVSPLLPDRSQSVLAAGGINSALDHKGQNDTVNEHFEDTMRAGCYLADEVAVRQLTSMAPKVIEWLQQIGVVFSLTKDGKIDQRYFGGQKKMRTVYSRSAIGKQLIAGISSQLQKYISQGMIKEYIGYEFVRLVCSGRWEKQKVEGCVIENSIDGIYIDLKGKAVIIASGGLNGFFSKTTGVKQNTGYVTAQLFSQGVKMSNLEMIQFHPTTVETSIKKLLISEAARGEGGRLFVYRNHEKWYFMEEIYKDGGNLMPRDVVSFEEYRQCEINGYGQVYLDLTHLSEDVMKHKIGEIVDLCKIYLGIDPNTDYIPVSPGVHYFMGGILTDDKHRTNVKGLFAAGECACTYHGANRLGGNSTMGAIVGGMTAGLEASKMSLDMTMQTLLNENYETHDVKEEEIMKEIQDILDSALPILRSQEMLEEGIVRLDNLKVKANTSYKIKMISFAEAMIKCAEVRKESRGAHKRIDYPDLNSDYKKITVATISQSGEVGICMEDTRICFD